METAAYKIYENTLNAYEIFWIYSTYHCKLMQVCVADVEVYFVLFCILVQLIPFGMQTLVCALLALVRHTLHYLAHHPRSV